ncbi:MAG TPA: chemotaxis protein CheB [Acidimicrobiales bacterium]
MTVVALTGSAGALTDIIDILARLPVDFAGAVVVLLHRQPDREGHLDEVLDRRCGLTVRNAAQDEKLSAGRAVVVPASCHMVVAPGGRARLVVSGAFPPNRPSADLLLSTMGVSLGERAIAVVLSGTGRDAATGATVIHNFGGIVIAADPETIQCPWMPSEAIERDESVDYVLPPRDIASLLAKLTDARRDGAGGESPGW